jgi:FtsP/CotA-like multicopper oxidase with cupredoxin domain
MNSIVKFIFILISINVSSASTVTYDLSIDYKHVTYTDKTIKGMAVNSSIPAPTLYFTEGDTALINVTNDMDVDTSVHWHGILLPNHEDGVPYVNHPPIKPGDSHLFRFTLKQSGTYWYHSHTGLQEQRGVYGAIVIHPAKKRSIKFDREQTVVLSDWINENPDNVLQTLKSGNDFYSIKKESKQNLLGAFLNNGLAHFFKQQLERMPSMDISDIAYDLFLANGQKETIIPAKAGEIIKLRLVNASTATYFSLQFAKGDIQIIAADGIDVTPLPINDFLMAIAETYTLLIKVPENGLFELRATAQDGSGYSSIWIGEGQRIPAPTKEKPNLYQMSMGDMDMGEMQMDKMAMSDHGKHHHHSMKPKPSNKTSQTPYKKLKALAPTTLPTNNTTREIELNLTGDMERYIWSINNEILSESNTIKIRRGENIRFVLNNKTMMHHPMHLHGHFFRVLNGQGKYSPLKHTIDVPPMGKQVIEFEANESQDWFFHCHILYHAKSGMARVIRYEDDEIDLELANIRHNLYRDKGFFYASGSFLSQMTDGTAILSNSKNMLQASWQVGWQNVDSTEYEVNITYERYFNRFFTAFAGVGLENEFERGIFGIRYLLPLNFESEWRIDTTGEFRISLGNNIQLTNNLNAFAEFEYDTEANTEWAAGLKYTLAKNIGLVTQYHSDFGIGAGARLSF